MKQGFMAIRCVIGDLYVNSETCGWASSQQCYTYLFIHTYVIS